MTFPDEPNPYTPPNVPSSEPLSEREKELRLWALGLHLSQLLSATAIGAPVGIIAPILIWQLKKAEFPELDIHGKNVANWMISVLIYAAICTALLFIFIGIPLFALLGILVVVFPIIGGIKANNGEVWKYPFTITFIR